jgi:hypothetical protein
MEKRPYFILGDLFVNGAAGIAAALASDAVVPSSWHPLAAMPLGMCVGAVSASLVALLFMPFLGAFEVMLPAMLTGMLAGTISSRLGDPGLTGASVGLAVVAWVYLLTARAGRSRDGRTSRA